LRTACSSPAGADHVERVDHRSTVPFRIGCAEDAARVQIPAEGRGMNTGVADAHDLFAGSWRAFGKRRRHLLAERNYERRQRHDHDPRLEH
jgi:2-polyprenyl-6-methoxyphenol hydroxylase-like FAD-dependent oxidoreductase